jgi:hypothetical protein
MTSGAALLKQHLSHCFVAAWNSAPIDIEAWLYAGSSALIVVRTAALQSHIAKQKPQRLRCATKQDL